MLERKIQNQILEYLRDNFPEAVVWKLSEQTICGVPDIMFAYKGKVIFFEVKAPNGKVSKIQEVMIRKLRKNSILAKVVYSATEVMDIVTFFFDIPII